MPTDVLAEKPPYLMTRDVCEQANAPSSAVGAMTALGATNAVGWIPGLGGTNRWNNATTRPALVGRRRDDGNRGMRHVVGHVKMHDYRTHVRLAER
jgi:hypothetical protein